MMFCQFSRLSTLPPRMLSATLGPLLPWQDEQVPSSVWAHLPSPVTSGSQSCAASLESLLGLTQESLACFPSLLRQPESGQGHDQFTTVSCCGQWQSLQTFPEYSWVWILYIQMYKITYDVPDTHMSSIGFSWPQARVLMIHDAMSMLFQELLRQAVTVLQSSRDYAVIAVICNCSGIMAGKSLDLVGTDIPPQLRLVDSSMQRVRSSWLGPVAFSLA